VATLVAILEVSAGRLSLLAGHPLPGRHRDRREYADAGEAPGIAPLPSSEPSGLPGIGFRPRACACARTKGRAENNIDYVTRNAISGQTFA